MLIVDVQSAKRQLFLGKHTVQMKDVVKDLKAAGFDTWLDYQELIPGTPWDEQINAGLANSDVLLLITSKEAIASPYVAIEIENAEKQGKRIFLALFESIELPENLQKFDWVDFRTDYKKGLASLVQRLTQPKSTREAFPSSGRAGRDRPIRQSCASPLPSRD